MKEKLYYQDQYLHSFKTNLTEQRQDDQERWIVRLKETCFYPEGGGQPADTGFINGSRVTDVQEKEGMILHYLDSPVKENEEVTCMIDWERRFDHMQQHAGQHILSAVFAESLGFETVSFHLGKETCTIDLDIGGVSEEECLKAEKLANAIILENRPIHTKWISEHELKDYPLRKKPAVKENIRLVIIPDLDYNGCGGTHPASTGEVGMIKILDWEKQKGIIRLTFVCGTRVARQLHEKSNILKDLTSLLNSPPAEMEGAVRTLIENGNKNEKLLDQARQTILRYEAQELIHNAMKLKGKQVVHHVFQHRSMADMQKLVRDILRDHEVLVLLVSENEDKLQFVFGSPSKYDLNMKELLESALAATEGKGGGSPSLVQGGGKANISGEELLGLLIDKL